MKIGQFILLFGLASILLAACAPATQPPNSGADQDSASPENGSTNDGNTPVLTWQRTGGIAGFCDEIEVFSDGAYNVANCSAQPSKRREQLDAHQRSMLTDWIARFTSFKDGEDSTTPSYPDQMFVNTIFVGSGSIQPSAEEIAAISNFAASLVAQPQTGGDYPDAVTKAREYLANKLGITSDQVEVVSVEAVEWPDSCLGVVIPDTMCAEVITPGYRILLQTEGRDYELHTDESGRNIQLAKGENR